MLALNPKLSLIFTPKSLLKQFYLLSCLPDLGKVSQKSAKALLQSEEILAFSKKNIDTGEGFFMTKVNHFSCSSLHSSKLRLNPHPHVTASTISFSRRISRS